MTVQDLFDFLGAWFAGVPAADINGSGAVSVQDIFDFQTSFFSGCTPCTADIRMVVFGDSLSDTGRHFASYGEPAAPSYQGRFSNGPVWVEYFAQAHGLSPSQVRNYAIGGATSGHVNCCTPGATGVLDEIAEFVHDRQVSNAFNPDALYIIWVGANDFETWQRTGTLTSRPPNELIGSAISNISEAIQTLSANGARRILVANLPDLGQIPRIIAMNDPVRANLATTGTIMFNANLAWETSRLEQSLGVDIVLMDVNSLFEGIQANPALAGFTDATTACYLGGGATPCANPGSHVFWDAVHPTTAAHQIVAGLAGTALSNGGMVLPSTTCNPPMARVVFTTPTGQFTTAMSVEVLGSVIGTLPPGAQLMVNGAAATIMPNGTFSVTVPMPAQGIEQPVVAELTLGGQVLDRDRIVAFHGPSLSQGQALQQSIIATITDAAVPPIPDEVTYQLAAHNLVNLSTRIPQVLTGNYSGTAQYELRSTGSGYSCNTVDLEMHNGFVRARFTLHDVFVRYWFHGWLSGVPDPGLDCNGSVYAANFSVYCDLSVAPAVGGSPGSVRVTAVSPLQFDLVSFNHTIDDCHIEDFAPFINFSSLIQSAIGNIEPAVRQAIEDRLDNISIASSLEQIIGGISTAGPVGNALGVTFNGNLQAIEEVEHRVTVRFESAVSGPVSTALRTLAVPRTQLTQGLLDPVSGDPYAFAASISLEALNQLLLAREDLLLRTFDVSTLDLGSGSFPVNAGLVSALIPSMRSMDPTTAYVLRVRPTSPPMFTGEQAAGCGGFDVLIPNVFVEITRPGASTTPDVAFATDLRLCVSLGIDAASGDLVPSITFPADGMSVPAVVENHVCADELTLIRVVEALRPLLAAKVSDAVSSFRMPALGGLRFSLRHAVAENGYASFYVDCSTAHARPDLTVAEIDVPSAIDYTAPFDVRFRVQNAGGAPAAGGAFMGASLSSDPIFANGNDIGLGVQFFDLSQNPLQPGQSRWFTLHNLHVTGSLPPNQTLFVFADVPANIGGGGILCESNERNNIGSTPILSTLPDAFVVSVQAPASLISTNSPGSYQVTVGRNNVGIEFMDVPFRVSLGAPPNGTVQDGIAQNVPRGGQVTVPIYVGTPPFSGTCGQTFAFSVTACTTLPYDSNPGDNCSSTSVPIAAPFWDLRFTFDLDGDGDTDGPASADRCDTIGWRVRITNVGNQRMPTPVCAITGLGRYSGAGNWNANLGLHNFNIPQLDPGESFTYQVSNYHVGFPPNCGSVYTGYQYIKAEINYASGCFDNCTAGANYAQHRIRIDP